MVSFLVNKSDYLREKYVKTLNFLFFFQINVILSHSLQREFFHHVDFFAIFKVSVFEIFDCYGKSGRKEHNLPFFGVKSKNALNYGLKVYRKQLICLVQDQNFCFAQIGDIFLRQISNSARSSYNNVHFFLQSEDIFLKRGSSCRNHALNVQILA